MKRVVIVHGWGGSPNEPWFVWLKNQLEVHDVEIEIPAMPNPDHPILEDWVKHLKTVITSPDEDTIFVGHSMGCRTILRYLQEINSEVGAAILVAGWMSLEEKSLETEEDRSIAMQWTNVPMDAEKIKKNCSQIIAFFSDNDPYVPLLNEQLYRQQLGAKTFIIPGKGHFSKKDAIEIPEVLAVIEELIKSRKTQGMFSWVFFVGQATRYYSPPSQKSQILKY